MSYHIPHDLDLCQVAMRALDFNVKKADVREIIEDQTKGRGDEIDQEDFVEIRMWLNFLPALTLN